MNKSFAELITIAEQLAGGQNRLKDTILKEVLHTDILQALQQSALGKSLVFQGGTALRLCYGNTRYSEDLDFVRSQPLDSAQFATFKATLLTLFAKRHAVQVHIKEPKQPLDSRTTANKVMVHRWTANIEIAKPGVRNQKIHIEVADIPAYDAKPRMIHSPYAQYGASPILLNVSSESEILADKIIAVAGRPYLKARDIWDIKWLRDKGISLQQAWVQHKARDYHLVTGDDMAPLIKRLQQKIQLLAAPATQRLFTEEMQRFLAKEQAEQWLCDEITTATLLMEVAEFIEAQIPQLSTPVAPDAQTNPSLRHAEKIRAWRARYNAR